MYRLTSQFKNLSHFIYIASFIIVIGLYMYFLTPSGFILYLLIFGIFSIARNFRALEEEIIYISANTIEYRRLGSTFEVRWENIKEISQGWYLYKQDCFVIDKSLIRIKEMSFWGYPILYKLFDFQNVIIPLSCFDTNWRDSGLGQQIKQYAPHLFEKEKSA